MRLQQSQSIDGFGDLLLFPLTPGFITHPPSYGVAPPLSKRVTRAVLIFTTLFYSHTSTIGPNTANTDFVFSICVALRYGCGEIR